MRFGRLAHGVWALAFCGWANAAHAGVNDLQIDWMIAEKEWASVKPEISGRDIDFGLQLLPSKLYITEEDVVAADGTKLLPAGTQLYGMTGRNLAVCSQLAAKPPYAGASNRVCFHDDDGDGALDSFWLRLPLQQMFGKADWFALNGELPADRQKVIAPKMRTVPSEGAEKLAELNLRIMFKKNGDASGAIWVKNGDMFSGPCITDVNAGLQVSEARCLIADFGANAANYLSKDKTNVQFEIVRPRRDVNVRFEISRGLLGFRVESISLQ